MYVGIKVSQEVCKQNSHISGVLALSANQTFFTAAVQQVALHFFLHLLPLHRFLLVRYTSLT